MSEFAGVLGLLSIVLGVAQCFFGYRIFRFLLGLGGFVVGAVLGAILGGTEGTLAAIVAAIVFGAVGASLAIWMYLVGIFLTGAAVGGAIGGLFGAAAESVEATVVLGLIGGIAGGVIGLKVQKFVIVVGTALQGGGAMVAGATLMTAPYLLSRSPEVLLRELYLGSGMQVGIWLLLTIAGIIVQYRSPVAHSAAQPAPVAAGQPEPPVMPHLPATPPPSVTLDVPVVRPRTPPAPRPAVARATASPTPDPSPRVLDLRPTPVSTTTDAGPPPAKTNGDGTWNWPTNVR